MRLPEVRRIERIAMARCTREAKFEGIQQLAAPRARRMSRPAPTLGGGALPIMAYTGKLGRIEYLFHASGI